jgi:acetyl-CoA acetyltransferase
MENLRDKIAIAGIGETEYVFRSDRGVNSLIIEAVQKALDDAKISPQEVDGIITEGQHTLNALRHNELAYNLGIHHRFSAAMASSGAGHAGLPLVAAMTIASGQADVVVAYYGSNWGTIRRKAYTYGSHGSNIKAIFEIPYGIYGAPVEFPMLTHRYMHEYGLTTRQLGSIAVNQRRNAILNGKGLMKKPLSYEDYENNPIVADPLRILDMTPMHDGACAWVMTSAERARDCPHVPVYVMGAGFGTFPMLDADVQTQLGENFIHEPSEGLALDRALQMAGITRDDLDFAEIYDAFTIMLLIFFESLGFCKMGEGGAFAESGAISLEGSLPVNTHGGHLSHSYMLCASHMIEAVRQLRGEAGACQVRDAKIGLVSGGSGISDGAATILRRD